MKTEAMTFDDQYRPISIPITDSTRRYEVFITIRNGAHEPVRISMLANSLQELIDGVCYDYGRFLSKAERLHVVEYEYERGVPDHLRRSTGNKYRSCERGWERETTDGWVSCDPFA